MRADAVLSFAGRLEQLASGIHYDDYQQAVLTQSSIEDLAHDVGETKSVGGEIEFAGTCWEGSRFTMLLPVHRHK